MKESEIFFEHYLSSAYSRFLDYDFSKLIVNHAIIELQIAQEIKDIISYYFSFLGYKVIQNKFYNHKFDFHLIAQFQESDRSLNITFRNEQVPSKNNFVISIDHFGAIRSINFEFPNNLTDKVAYLSKIIEKYVVKVYTSLEYTFKSKCEHMADRICNRVSSILNSHLLSIDKEHLQESTRFFIFQKGVGFFYFEREAYSRTIDFFKENQSSMFSPYELLVWLVTNPLPYSKSLSSESFKNNKVVWQEWNKAVFQDERKFYEAARKLYDFKAYGVFPFYQTKNNNFSISVAFKKEHKSDIVPELNKLKPQLIDEFEKSLKSYSSLIIKSDLLDLQKRLNSRAYIYAEIVGYSLAAFFKGYSRF